MLAWIQRFWSDQTGATAVEYAMVASLIGVIIFAAVGTMGGKLSEVFSGLTNRF